MGIHHAWGRTLKDAYIRYQAMNGKSCQYQNGFDGQGLWVEVEVEKSLGFTDKSDILKYGMDKFTEACIARVKKFSDIITEQSKRLGQWMDWDNSYYTNTDLNITSIWHFLKVCHEKGWLKKHIDQCLGVQDVEQVYQIMKWLVHILKWNTYQYFPNYL